MNSKSVSSPIHAAVFKLEAAAQLAAAWPRSRSTVGVTPRNKIAAKQVPQPFSNG